MAVDLSTAANRIAYIPITLFDNDPTVFSVLDPLLQLPIESFGLKLVFHIKILDEAGAEQDADFTVAPDETVLLATDPKQQFSEKTLSIKTAAVGTLECDIDHPDFNKVGVWYFQIRITYSDGILHSRLIPVYLFSQFNQPTIEDL